MIRRNNILMLCMTALMPVAVAAQSLRSDNATVDVGQVKYCHPATATFVLRNLSSNAVKVTDVDGGCGCISAEWSKDVINPNTECRIKVTYDARQLGHFQRSVIVTDDSGEAPCELAIKGNVVLEVENFSGSYPVVLGNLLADGNVVEFDDVNKGARFVRDIHVMNPSGQYVEPIVLHAPAYLKAEVIPARLAPKQGGIVRLTLDTHKVRSYGLTQTGIYIVTSKGEKVSEDKEVTVSTVLLPPHTAADDAVRQYGPKIEVSATEIDMTDFRGKSKKKAEVLITNTGRMPLEIRSLQMFTAGLEVTLPKRKLAPGETVKMKVTGIQAQLKKVKSRPRILMITNAVNMQKVLVNVKL